MAIRLKTDYLTSFISEHEYALIQGEVNAAHENLIKEGEPSEKPIGWMTLPVNYDKEEFDRILKAAEKIKKSCDIFIAIGIGGSYLGARAAIEFVKGASYNAKKKDTPDVYFAGNTIDPDALQELLEICEGRDICINVISKSGSTTEPAASFRVFRELLEKKYGAEGARERIFVTTDKKDVPGKLKHFAIEKGYETFVVPDDIGGRYSVLSAVGLLPIAVAGCDIRAIMAGAKKAMEDFSSTNIEENDCYKYAAIRNLLVRKGYEIELFVSYKPSFMYMNEWLKQLFGESEGKDKKGLFPASVIYSTDLHSMGQYLQDGRRIIFETVVDVLNSKNEVKVPYDASNIDNLNFLADKDFHYVNKQALLGTLDAHVSGGVPNVVLELDKMDEENFGYTVYFFELACALSGYILGVNPFNQPGVEVYKKNMFKLLGKPE
ncbi:MAG: glucose-6-phosphate isomerase [Ruminococcaceae bacterium]|nr:glucose-6-phosphate isomerase [Oscillospiraceae bacterium]